MKKLLLLAIVTLIFNSCVWVKNKKENSFHQTNLGSRSFCIKEFSKLNAHNYILNPSNHNGFKFIIKAEVDGDGFDVTIFGKVFEEDEWELIKTYNTPRMEYMDNFLYYRKIMMVSKSGVFKVIKTKLFLE